MHFQRRNCIARRGAALHSPAVHWLCPPPLSPPPWRVPVPPYPPLLPPSPPPHDSHHLPHPTCPGATASRHNNNIPSSRVPSWHRRLLATRRFPPLSLHHLLVIHPFFSPRAITLFSPPSLSTPLTSSSLSLSPFNPSLLSSHLHWILFYYRDRLWNCFCSKPPRNILLLLLLYIWVCK